MKKLLFIAFIFFQVFVNAQAPTNGMIAYFPFNGNSLNSGSANITASLVNITNTTNNLGMSNSAIQFAGNVNSYVNFTDNGNLDFSGTNNFSICLAFYHNGSSNAGLFDNCLNYGGPGVWFWNISGDTWNIQANYKNSSVGAPSATNFYINQWNHVVFIRNNGTLSVYINGVFRLSTSEGSMTPTYPLPPINGALSWSGYSPPRYIPFSGKMDELRIYDRALSVAEITAVYNDYATGGTQPVTITCPSNLTVANDAGQCGANVTYPSATATGSPTPTITYSKESGSFFSVGTTTIIATATDGTGSNASCSFTVTVTGGVDTDNDAIADVCDPDDDGDLTPDASDCAPLDATKWQQASLYVDGDNDGYTNGQQLVCYGSTIPAGFKLNSLGSDCNDANPAVWQSASLYIDNDDDGYTNGQQTVCYGVSIPTGYKANSLGNDCNDSNPAIHPGATELCNDIDDDCDGSTDEGFINTVVSCPFTGSITRSLTTGCTYTINGNEFNATVSENCGPLGYTLTGATSGSGTTLASVQLNTGTTTVTWSATNANDQSFGCSFNVYVLPPLPVITCPGNIVVPATTAQCGAVVNYVAPTLPQLCANNDVIPPATSTFNYSGQIVNWVVPPGVTSIRIKTLGAKGGTITGWGNLSGGKGASIEGTFSVTPGETLKILVGGQGVDANTNDYLNSGGGGGSFVWKNTGNTLLLAAGGGSGVGNCGNQNGAPGLSSFGSGSGGQGGNFATCGLNRGGGGGAGWLSDGTGTAVNPNIGGKSPLNGGAGGVLGFGDNFYKGTPGGFGGGGSGGGNCGGPGGGGGYTGGNGGDNILCGTSQQRAQGGSSYNAGTGQVNQSDVNSGNGLITITYGGGNVPGVTQIAGLVSGSNFPVGSTTNTFLVTDAFGQTNTCSFTVTVNDQQAPSIIQPVDITVANTMGQCSAPVTFSASASDNCAVSSLKYYLNYNTPNQEEISSPKTFTVGSYSVTVVAKDAANNTTTKTFTITVDDTQKPIVSAGSIGGCHSSVALAEAAALDATDYSDNCSSFEELNVTVSTTGTCNAVITVTVTDAANNSRSVTYNTKIDNTSPVLSVTPGSLTVSCQSVPSVPTVTASDNCDGAVNVTFTPTSTQGNDPAQSSYYNYIITRKWSASDACGNTVGHTQTITVQDVTVPGLTCPGNISVSNEPGLCSASVSFNASSSDNCSTPTVKYYLYHGTPAQQEISSPRTFAVGSYTVKVVSTDPSGNSSECTFAVMVTDTEKPTVTKGSIQSCYKTVAAAETAALAATTFSDNCTPNVQLNVQAVTVGTCSAAITVTVTDAANNSRYVTYYTRIDNTSPVLNITPGNTTVSCQSIPPVPTVTASDNCDGAVNVTFTPTSTQGIDPAQSSYYNYIITRKWFASDACGNTVEHTQTITVQDITDPIITCPADKLDVPFDFGQLYATIAIGSATASDNCAAPSNIIITGARSDNVAIINQQYPLGQTTVSWTAIDPSDNSDNCTQIITVRKRNTAITYTGEMTDNKIVVQYSDIINLQAKLTDNEGLLTPNNISGRTITFQLLNGSTVLRSKTAITNASGIAADTFKVDQAPGLYLVKTIFNGDNYFNGSIDQDNCEVKQEDAIIEYNGSQYFTTASSTTMNGSVTLAAALNDIDDGANKRGDIRKAKATFRDGGPGGTVLGSSNLPVGLVNPGVLVNGLSATSQSYSLNTNEAGSGGKIFQVWVGASDHYTGADAGPTPVTLALPGQDFVTGGGHLVLTNSAGTYAGTTNSKMNFGFTMKWNKSGKNLQGQINIVFRKWQLYNGTWQWRVYQAKSNAINSMAVVEVGSNGQPASGSNPAMFRKAIINTKSNLKDVTDPLNNIDLGGNHNLVLDAWDHITANGGVSDKISVMLMGSTTNELLFSSSWISNATVAQTITGGNINVRNGSGSSATTANITGGNTRMESTEPEKEVPFAARAYPNPTQHQFTLVVNGSTDETIQIQVYDVVGRTIQSFNARPNELIKFGEKLKAGVYFAKVIQGTKQETLKLIKQ